MNQCKGEDGVNHLCYLLFLICKSSSKLFSSLTHSQAKKSEPEREPFFFQKQKQKSTIGFILLLLESSSNEETETLSRSLQSPCPLPQAWAAKTSFTRDIIDFIIS